MTSFYPAVSSRASTQLGISRLLFQIHHDENALLKLQEQLSTGRRVNRPSESPVDAIKGLTAQRELEFKKQLKVNLRHADDVLTTSEATLAQAQSILHDMRGLAVEATGTTRSDTEIQAYIDQVQAAITRLTELGNTRIGDRYLFGGSFSAGPPLTAIGDAVRFGGNEAVASTITDYGVTTAANVTAQEVFGVRSEQVVGRVDLNPAIAGTTPLSDLNRGSGVPPGSISLSDGTDTVEIDLSAAYDLNDVLRELNNVRLGGRDVSATLTASGLRLEYADGGPGIILIDEVGSGSTAEALKINNQGSLGMTPVIGGDLDPVLTQSTALVDLLGGAGLPSATSFRITQDGTSYAISISGAETVEDLLNRINHSGARVRAGIDPTGRFLTVQSLESGTVMSIGEQGSNLASLLGIRTFDLNTPVEELNLGEGIFVSDQVDDLRIVRTDGSSFTVNLDGVQTVADVLDRINSHVANFTPSLRVTASLATNGNGIVLRAPAGAGQIQVQAVGGSQAAWGLGLIAAGSESASGSTVGSESVLTGYDVSGVEVEGVFTSLIRMRQALENGTPEDMQRVAAALERDVERLAMARGAIGARQQAIQQTQELTEHQELQLRQAESDALDTDFTQVVSDLTARQAALQASLKLMGQTVRLTLLDYL
ncbi:MAG: flagellin [Pirellulaceae bacterium]|nr:MAG: flagellin [Pirellulaceae bacterium]